jgi:hypothetical protein
MPPGPRYLEPLVVVGGGGGAATAAGGATLHLLVGQGAASPPVANGTELWPGLLPTVQSR